MPDFSPSADDGHVRDRRGDVFHARLVKNEICLQARAP
jgi:hypothetical protein